MEVINDFKEEVKEAKNSPVEVLRLKSLGNEEEKNDSLSSFSSITIGNLVSKSTKFEEMERERWKWIIEEDDLWKKIQKKNLYVKVNSLNDTYVVLMILTRNVYRV
jgi:hypothetical protein